MTAGQLHMLFDLDLDVTVQASLAGELATSGLSGDLSWEVDGDLTPRTVSGEAVEDDTQGTLDWPTMGGDV